MLGGVTRRPMAGTTLAILSALLFVVAISRTSGLRPGGRNVLKRSQVYYVSVRTTTKQVRYRRTCTRTCFVWGWGCSNRCRTVGYYTWVPTYKTVKRTRAVYVCRPGWRASGDECTIPICTASCQNGGVCVAPNTCRCTTHWTGSTCRADVDECQPSSGTQHGCQDTCVNFPGGYRCSCPKGFNLTPNGKNCTDVDECAGNTPGCQQGCDNFPGGYNCTCYSGYRRNISDSKSCDDINECQPSSGVQHGCQEMCVNFPGGYNCSCPKGHYLASNGKNCTDHDECAGNIHGCQQGCDNFPGGYNCTCYPGYQRNISDPKSCDDVDECEVTGLQHHDCQEICINFIGGYNCSCPKGYYLASNGKNCSDVNECGGSTHGCEQGCDNFPGDYNCTCYSGYRLNVSDFKSCDDVDECLENISGCAHQCSNSIGNYSCSCNTGYHLETDGKSCNDIDECSSGLDDCEHNCLNNVGSYSCYCRPGFDLASDGRHCIGRPCKRIYTPVNGRKNCSGNTTEHVCHFQCFPGYDLIGSSNRTCSAITAWTGNETSCEIIHCPSPVGPRQGFVYTPCNTEFTSECIVGCARGYFIEESNKITCNASGAWEPTNRTCAEIKACLPDPCSNGGKCSPISSSRYSCDCSGTGYIGSTCKVGIINVPQYPPLTRGVRSSPLQYQSSPISRDYVMLTPSSLGAVFNPPFLIFNTTSSKQSLTMTPRQSGLFFIQYSLSGPNAVDFQPPKKDVVFVDQIKNSTNQTSGNQSSQASENWSRDVTLPIGCHHLEVSRCHGNGDAIVFSSTSPWSTLGPVTSSGGVVSVTIGKTTFPLSLLGTSVRSVSPPSSECGQTNTNHSVKELMKSHVLTRSYLKAFKDSFPSWLAVSFPQNFDSKAVFSSNAKVYFLSVDNLRQSDAGKGQPLADKTSFSLLESQSIDLTIEDRRDVLRLRGYKGPFSIVADLCSPVPKNVILRPSPEDADLVNNASVFKRLRKNGWDLTITSLQISKARFIEKLEKGLYWDGKRFMRIGSPSTGNLAMVLSLRKSFTQENIVNCYFEFNGTIVVGVDDMESILQSPLDQNWSVDLYGNTKLRLQFKVEGKNTNVTLNAPKSITYATFGGNSHQQSSFSEESSPNAPGLYMSHVLDEPAFSLSDLAKFVELGPNRTISVFVNIDLRSNLSGNQSSYRDQLNYVSAVFQGDIKFGPLRFKNLDINLRAQNTRQPNKTTLFPSNGGIELSGDNPATVSEEKGKFGIFVRNPLNPRLFISSEGSRISSGSFQSTVHLFGFEKGVNVSFSAEGLVFNTSAKVFDLYDSFIQYRSPLASWRDQTFVATGSLDVKADGLAGDLGKAMYEYGSRMFERARRRVESFENREARVNARLENMTKFTEAKRRELNKTREEYKTAEAQFEAALEHLKNIEANVSARLDHLRSEVDKLCDLVKRCPEVCQEGVVCRDCDYQVVGKTKETCLSGCFKTEQRIMKSNSSSVPCEKHSCRRVYLKSGLSKEKLRNSLTLIKKQVFSLGKKGFDPSSTEFSSAEMDYKETFSPGNSQNGVCKSFGGDTREKSDMEIEKKCGEDDRDGHWDCRVRSEMCSTTVFEREFFHEPYTCEQPCEHHVANASISRSCCTSVACAFKIVNVTCVAGNALCRRLRRDALEKDVMPNTSPDILKKVEIARMNVSYWEIMKRMAAIRLSSALKLLNISEKAVRNLEKAYNITRRSDRNISRILAPQLKLKKLLNEPLRSVSLITFESIEFKVKVRKEDWNSLLPVRIVFNINGTRRELSAVLDFKHLNTSLRGIAKDILDAYTREPSANETSRRKRSADETRRSTSGLANGTERHTISSLQKYHRLCAQFTNNERALFDMSMSLYNVTSEIRRLILSSNVLNLTESFNASRVLENWRVNYTAVSKFRVSIEKRLYLKSLESDPVLLGAVNLQKEAADDGFKPLHLNSELLFGNWYAAMENIFNVVLKNCSGFEDCFTFVVDSLSDINEATNLPGADRVRQQIADLEIKLAKLTENVDMPLDEAAEISWDILSILKAMKNVKLFCARAPNITKQPEPLTEIGVTETLVLTCAATGDSLVYNWMLGENILEDQNRSVLMIRDATTSHGGNYRCVVSNHISKETSTPALVVIHAPPLIIVQPTERLNVTLSVNDSLRCVAESTDHNITYQWWFKSISWTFFVALPNEVFSYLNFAPMSPQREGWYYCNISNSFGFSISRRSFVKALSFSLPVSTANLSISIAKKLDENVTRVARSVSTGYAVIQSQISELLLSVGGNSLNVTKPEIRDLRLVDCTPMTSSEIRASAITEACQWGFKYVGQNMTTNSSVGDSFGANAEKVIRSTRDLERGIGLLRKAISDGPLSFVLGDQRFVVEKNSLSVDDVSAVCSPGRVLVQEDFRCVDCLPGSYGTPDRNTIETCLPCPVGSYQSNSGQTSCRKCPEGFTTLSQGSLDRNQCKVICPRGQFGRITQDIGLCLECSLDTYQPETGQFNCLPCPDGRVTTTKGTDDISKCIREPTERQTTRSGTRGPGIELRQTTTAEGPAVRGLNKSDGGTKEGALFGGIIGAIVFFGVLGGLLLWRSRRRKHQFNFRQDNSNDGKNVVARETSVKLNDWRVNPAFVEDSDFSDQNFVTENPVYASNVDCASPSCESASQENPMYEPKSAREQVWEENLQDDEPRYVDTSCSSDLKVYKSHEDAQGATNFFNPLYETLADKAKKKQDKIEVSGDTANDENV